MAASVSRAPAATLDVSTPTAMRGRARASLRRRAGAAPARGAAPRGVSGWSPRPPPPGPPPPAAASGALQPLHELDGPRGGQRPDDAAVHPHLGRVVAGAVALAEVQAEAVVGRVFA